MRLTKEHLKLILCIGFKKVSGIPNWFQLAVFFVFVQKFGARRDKMFLGRIQIDVKFKVAIFFRAGQALLSTALRKHFTSPNFYWG
jgi:hypothetical protein